MKRDEQKTLQYQELVPFGFRLATVLAITGLVLVIVGCDAQRGKFVTTGEVGQPLLNPVGSIDIISGVENGSDDASDRHLLYLLMLTPGLRASGSGSSSDYGTYITTLNRSWNTDKGPFSVSVSWDRKRDVVKIGNREFERSAGDVFVIMIDTNGTVSGEQLPSLNTPSDASGLLHYVQQQLPNDKRILGIRVNGSTSNEMPEDLKDKLPSLAKLGMYDEALALVRPYADGGNAEAQFTMAVGLLLKEGEKSNDKEMAQWARKAAAQNYPQALGFMEHGYQWGEYGLPTNHVMAAMWGSARTNADMIAECLDYERHELKVR